MEWHEADIILAQFKEIEAFNAYNTGKITVEEYCAFSSQLLAVCKKTRDDYKEKVKNGEITVRFSSDDNDII